MDEKQLKETIKGLYNALNNLHKATLYQLCEADTRPTHVSCDIFDEVEEALANARKFEISE